MNIHSPLKTLVTGGAGLFVGSHLCRRLLVDGHEVICLDLMQKTGKTIMYVPEMRVWHHRRAGLLTHLNQVGGYGLHRGFFTKKYPQNSRKIKYALPSFLVLLTLATPFLITYAHKVGELYIVPWGIYSVALILALKNILNYESFWVGICAIPYIVLTHWWYGVRFIQGIYTSKLESRLR
jgi:hypothetical protein